MRAGGLSLVVGDSSDDGAGWLGSGALAGSGGGGARGGRARSGERYGGGRIGPSRARPTCRWKGPVPKVRSPVRLPDCFVSS